MPKIETITREVLVKINKKFTKTGIRSNPELDSIIYKVGKTRGINQKAATLLIEIIRRHPFVDGNKRTAFDAMIVFLEANNKKLDVRDSSKMNVIFWVVRPKTNVKDIAVWIANHTRW
ncbi:type II toxin-antitoxin system death-on-curing family toxin [Candidatus Woesearchaeota archaeon]|nr:type II toxin-antitoxin system death-on-curing family toxin [Candidatus Woesearchaeota archaeon]